MRQKPIQTRAQRVRNEGRSKKRYEKRHKKRDSGSAAPSDAKPNKRKKKKERKEQRGQSGLTGLVETLHKGKSKVRGTLSIQQRGQKSKMRRSTENTKKRILMA